MPEGLDLKYNHEPICPYCGRRFTDAWELDFGGMEGSTTVTCYGCERDFFVEREVTVTYSTAELTPKP